MSEKKPKVLTPKEIYELETGLRKCTNCNEEKLLCEDNFKSFYRKNKLYHSNTCIQCKRSISTQKARDKRKERVGCNRNLDRYEFEKDGFRKCNICEEIKPLNEQHFGIVIRDLVGGVKKSYFKVYCNNCIVRKKMLRKKS